jgi:histidine triad (HIT) family protein
MDRRKTQPQLAVGIIDRVLSRSVESNLTFTTPRSLEGVQEETAMKDCIFCKIIRGESPSSRVFENDKILAFLDINPVSKGHTLVIPKTHYAGFSEIPADFLIEMGQVLQRLGQAAKTHLGSDGFNVLLNNGRAAGQLIDHAHFHLVPRSTGDGVMGWPRVRPYGAGEMETVRSKLAQALS